MTSARTRTRRHAAGFLGLGLLLTVVLSPGAPAQVRVNESGGRAYHHLALPLTAEMLHDPPETDDGALAYRLSEGGMFEVFLQPDSLPGVAAPGCSRIVVRMPWTDPDAPEAGPYIAAKAALLDQILAVRAGTAAEAPAVLELDPYLRPTAQGYELTECTAFFRTARGRYVEDAGPLPPG